MPDIRQTSFDIIHRLRATKSRADVYAELRAAGEVFGYDAFLIGGLPQTEAEGLLDCAMITGWPDAWSRRYHRQGYLHQDPVIRQIRQTAEPFLWTEAARVHADARGILVMDEARGVGLKDGFCVPFHDLDGREAGVSFGGERLSLSEDERAGLHLVAIYAMSKARAVSAFRGKGGGDPISGLTEREIECLKWSAAGKSAWDTSQILTISARTVEAHLASAARKLNAVNRVQSIAEALRRGIIA
ncbi:MULTISPECIES: helix-turn-helix transcriptional regulator [Methylobacterium]|uniref:helix-turn-helix transcriptional regulator n=1 Tax=Methylobacterium TaxID=407 RepID=UPI0010497E68|nr:MULTISPECIES: LuxR family transcriptional regulator [Methylobacterium]MDR7039890.1 LuxR family quorum sensing-dependent transcriptional regulator [Methylobacterium sp. BE186]